jgi:DNA transposition AAA+ family ATPase
MPKPRKPFSLSDLLRQELAEVPSVNAVSKAIGVGQPSLSRFLSGEYDGLTLDAASKLLAYFGFVVAKPTAPNQPAAKPNTAKPSATKTKPTNRPAAKR